MEHVSRINPPAHRPDAEAPVGTAYAAPAGDAVPYAPTDGGPPPALPAGALTQPASRYAPPAVSPPPDATGYDFGAVRRANAQNRGKRVLVPVPEWDGFGPLYAQRLSREDVTRIAELSQKKDDAGADLLDEDGEPDIDTDLFGVHLIMGGIYAEDGTTRPFNNAAGRDLLLDPDTDFLIINRLVKAVTDLNGMSKEARKKIRKNSAPRTGTNGVV